MEARPDQIERRRARYQRRARTVGWVKILLPIGAILLIAAIFVTGRERGDITDLMSAEDIARLGAGLKLDNPRLAGIAGEEELPYELTAVSATPDGPMADKISFEKPEGSVRMPDRSFSARADGGMLDREAKLLTLDGSVQVETSDGWTAETEAVTVELDQRTARAPGNVRAKGPNGELEAGSFRVEATEGDDPSPIIFFENSVRVLFIPPNDDG